MPVCAWWRIEGAQGLSGFVHDYRRARNEGPGHKSDKLSSLRQGACWICTFPIIPLECVSCPAKWSHLRIAGHGPMSWAIEEKPRNGPEGPRSRCIVRWAKDESTPYFSFQSRGCASSCSRCVAGLADEVQGTFALTIQGRGLSNRRFPRAQNEPFPGFRMRLVLARGVESLSDRCAPPRSRSLAWGNPSAR